MPSSHSSVLVSTVRWSMKGRKASLGSRLSGGGWLRTMSACLLVYAVCAADGDAALPIQLVHLAVQSEELVRKLRLHHDLAAEAPRPLISQARRRAALVVVNCQTKCNRN